MSIRHALSAFLAFTSRRPIEAAVGSVIQQLENRTLLTAVSAIDFDYGISPQAIRVTFDSPINPSSLSSSDLFVRKVGSDSSRIAPSFFTSSLNGANTVATFEFNSGIFPEGDYVVDLFKGDVLDAQGQSLSVDANSSFYFLHADLSGPNGSRDRVVNSTDTSYVLSRLGTANPTYGDGDINGDGAVTIDDAYAVMDYYDTKLITPVDGLKALTATASGTAVELAWVRQSTTNTGFRVQRSTDGGRNFTTLVTSLAATADSFLDTTADLQASGYVYRVRSIEPNQPFSSTPTPSRYFTAAIERNATEGESALQPPTDLRVTSVGKNAISLKWSDKSTGEAGFQIYRSDNGGATYNPHFYLEVANATAWTDSNLKAAKTYYYYLKARGTELSGPSNVASGTTLAGAPTALGADLVQSGATHRFLLEFDQDVLANLGSTIESDKVSIYSLLDGRQFVAGESGEFFVVNPHSGDKLAIQMRGHLRTDLPNLVGVLPNGNFEIALDGSAVRNAAFQTIADTSNPQREGIASTFFLRGDFNRDRRVNYDDLLILAQNYGGTGKTQVTGDTDFDLDVDFDDLLYVGQRYNTGLPTPMVQGNELIASTAYVSDTSHEVFVQWTPPTNPAEPILGYRVWRSIDGATFNELPVTLGASDHSFIDNDGLKEGERYTYRVRPFSASGLGVTTNRASVVTTLKAPSDIAVTALSDTSLRVSWTDHSENESGFRVYRVLKDGSYELLKTVAPYSVSGGGPVSTDLSVTANTAYTIRVVSFTQSANSAFLEIKAAASLAGTTSNISDGITLTWPKPSEDVDLYRVMRQLPGHTNWTQLDSVDGTQTSYADRSPPLGYGRTYAYKVIPRSSATGEDLPAIGPISVNYAARPMFRWTTNTISLDWPSGVTAPTALVFELTNTWTGHVASHTVAYHPPTAGESSEGEAGGYSITDLASNEEIEIRFKDPADPQGFHGANASDGKTTIRTRYPNSDFSVYNSDLGGLGEGIRMEVGPKKIEYGGELGGERVITGQAAQDGETITYTFSNIPEHTYINAGGRISMYEDPSDDVQPKTSGGELFANASVSGSLSGGSVTFEEPYWPLGGGVGSMLYFDFEAKWTQHSGSTATISFTPSGMGNGWSAYAQHLSVRVGYHVAPNVNGSPLAEWKANAPGVISVSRGNAVKKEEPLIVNLEIVNGPDGDSASASDLAMPSSIRIEAGEDGKSVPITVVDDEEIESSIENIWVRFTPVGGVEPFIKKIGYIEDDDFEIVSASMTFNDQGLKRDSLNDQKPYNNDGAPDWYHTGANGSVGNAGTKEAWAPIWTTAKEQNGTNTDHSYPLSFSRSVLPVNNVVRMTPAFKVRGNPVVNEVRAVASGLVSGSAVNISVQVFDAPEADPAFKVVTPSIFNSPGPALATIPQIIDAGNLQIDLTLLRKKKSGTDVKEVNYGPVVNRAYITGAAAPNAFHTVIAIGSEKGFGKVPDGIAGANDKAIVDEVWAVFFTKKVLRVDDPENGTGMRYWGPISKAQPNVPEAMTMEFLLKNGDGRCGGWSDMFYNILKSQGVQNRRVDIVRPIPVPAEAGYRYERSTVVVKTFLSQGGDAETDYFDDHQLNLFGDTLYDPSYGSTPISEGSVEANWLKWEDNYLRFVEHKFTKLADNTPGYTRPENRPGYDLIWRIRDD